MTGVAAGDTANHSHGSLDVRASVIILGGCGEAHLSDVKAEARVEAARAHGRGPPPTSQVVQTLGQAHISLGWSLHTGGPLAQASLLFPSFAAGSPSAKDGGAHRSLPLTHAGSPAGGAASPTPCPEGQSWPQPRGASLCLAALPRPLPLTCSRHPQGTGRVLLPSGPVAFQPRSWPSGLRTRSMRLRVGDWLWQAVTSGLPAWNLGQNPMLIPAAPL